MAFKVEISGTSKSRFALIMEKGGTDLIDLWKDNKFIIRETKVMKEVFIYYF